MAALKKNRSLLQLVLDGNPIGNEGAKALMRVQMVKLMSDGDADEEIERTISLAGSAEAIHRAGAAYLSLRVPCHLTPAQSTHGGTPYSRPTFVPYHANAGECR